MLGFSGWMTGIPRLDAHVLIAFGVTCLPLPDGLSGWVMTVSSRTVSDIEIRHSSRNGTAMLSEPMKTALMGMDGSSDMEWMEWIMETDYVLAITVFLPMTNRVGKSKQVKIRQSAGILMYDNSRGNGDELRVLVVHPGGPLFTHKNEGYWSIPKGEFHKGEKAFEAAVREFEEETGMKLMKDADYLSLGMIIQKGGKVVYAWAVEGDWEGDRKVVSNSFKMEWPPSSGVWMDVPEIDRAEMAPVERAKELLKTSQVPFIERLQVLLAAGKT